MQTAGNTSYHKKAIFLILCFTAVRIILSAFLDLGNDESYYWTYSRRLQWNYFDHPPLVALWIRFFTVDLWLQDSVFFIRLGSFVSAALASWFIYLTTARISTPKAAFIAVFLYNTSFYACITAGLMIMPDTPQMVFWTGGMHLLTRILENDRQWKYWLLFGLAAGLCIMSKVHGVFLWGGVVLYALFYRRQWFLRPQPYVAGLLTLAIIAPIIVWNIQHNFITYSFHAQRVVINESERLHWDGLLQELIGQLVINNPLNVALMAVFLFSKKLLVRQPAPLVLFRWLSFPLLMVIAVIALFRDSLPHWSGPAYIALIPVAAIGVAGMKLPALRRVLRWGGVYAFLFISFIIVSINFYPGTFGVRSGKELGTGDIGLDSYGWKEAGEAFSALYNQQYDDENPYNKPPLVCNTWWGAHQEYYFARPLGVRMVALGNIGDIRHYRWRNPYTLQHVDMDTAYCIVHSHDYYNAKQTYSYYYTHVDSLTTISIPRGGKPAHNFYIYRLTGFRNPNAGSLSKELPLANSLTVN